MRYRPKVPAARSDGMSINDVHEKVVGDLGHTGPRETSDTPHDPGAAAGAGVTVGSYLVWKHGKKAVEALRRMQNVYEVTQMSSRIAEPAAQQVAQRTTMLADALADAVARHDAAAAARITVAATPWVTEHVVAATEPSAAQVRESQLTLETFAGRVPNPVGVPIDESATIRTLGPDLSMITDPTLDTGVARGLTGYSEGQIAWGLRGANYIWDNYLVPGVEATSNYVGETADTFGITEDNVFRKFIATGVNPTTRARYAEDGSMLREPLLSDEFDEPVVSEEPAVSDWYAETDVADFIAALPEEVPPPPFGLPMPEPPSYELPPEPAPPLEYLTSPPPQDELIEAEGDPIRQSTNPDMTEVEQAVTESVNSTNDVDLSLEMTPEQMAHQQAALRAGNLIQFQKMAEGVAEGKTFTATLQEFSPADVMTNAEGILVPNARIHGMSGQLHYWASVGGRLTPKEAEAISSYKIEGLSNDRDYRLTDEQVRQFTEAQRNGTLDDAIQAELDNLMRMGEPEAVVRTTLNSRWQNSAVRNAALRNLKYIKGGMNSLGGAASVVGVGMSIYEAVDVENQYAEGRIGNRERFRHHTQNLAGFGGGFAGAGAAAAAVAPELAVGSLACGPFAPACFAAGELAAATAGGVVGSVAGRAASGYAYDQADRLFDTPPQPPPVTRPPQPPVAPPVPLFPDHANAPASFHARTYGAMRSMQPPIHVGGMLCVRNCA
jgi:hypothetical protein